MSNPKNDIGILRVQLKKIEKQAVTTNSLEKLNASLQEKIEAINQGVGAVAASVLNVSNNLNTSIETTAMGLQGALEANTVAILGNINELSGNIKDTIQQRTEALQEGLTRIVDVLLPTSTSNLQQRADALENSLNTLINVTLPGEFTSKVAAGQLEVSLRGLINQNETTFQQRLDQSDGKLDGVINDVTIITGSWSDYTASINEYTGSAKADMNEVKQFKSDTTAFNNIMKRKTDAFSQDESDETNYRTSLLQAVAGSDFKLLKTLNYNTSRNILRPYPVPENYYAYTVSYPIGTKPFKINSYSYMGTDAGKKTWNLEEVIAYSKREYTVHDGFVVDYGAYDANNTMKKDASGNPIITQESQLSFKADKIIAEKGRTNTTSPTLTIIGETSDTNGYNLNQGQLFIRDEDSSTSGLQIGYRYQLINSYVDDRGNTINNVAEHGRIQATKLNGTTDLYLNPAGGSVRIGRLNDSYLTEGTIELNYYGYGDRNSFIDFHSDNTYGRPGSNNTSPTDGDYSGRIIRWSGVNGMMEIVNRGAGGIRNTVINGTGNIFDWYVGTSRLMYLNSNGSLTIAGAYAPSSDERIKTDILTSSLGLEFINNLNPVQYKFIVADEIIDLTKEKLENNKIVNDGSRKAGIRNHYGFIAQEVKKAAGDRDFAAVIYEPEKDLYKLNHQEFISPMVKAIQELSQKNDYLEKKLEEKDKQLQDILLRLSALEGK